MSTGATVNFISYHNYAYDEVVNHKSYDRSLKEIEVMEVCDGCEDWKHHYYYFCNKSVAPYCPFLFLQNLLYTQRVPLWWSRIEISTLIGTHTLPLISNCL